MKTVFKHYDEIARLWATRAQPEARMSGRPIRMFFRGPTIYSYGDHFPIARWVKRQSDGADAILFTARSYSRTTESHKSCVRTTCHMHATGIPVFVVPDVMCEKWPVDHWHNQVNALVGLALRAKVHAPAYLRQLDEVIAEANRIAEWWDLVWRLNADPVDLQTLRARVRLLESAATLG